MVFFFLGKGRQGKVRSRDFVVFLGGGVRLFSKSTMGGKVPS